MAILRLVVILLVCLGVVYVSLYHFLCEHRRERLERGFASSAPARERAAFVDAGVRAYAGRVRRRLAIAVFGVPLLLIAAYIAATNPL